MAMFLTGCATTAMKGTPFYTGEWPERTGLVEDRVALWPLVYYREPALSILWPIFEMTPAHLAVRPVYSMQNRSTDHPTHNVLWPLGRFDTGAGRYRFFPFYWGEDHTVVFPLYWHLGKPFQDEGGVHSVFPLYHYQRSADSRVLKLAWPLARFERGDELSRNRIFPLFSTARWPNGDKWFRSLPYGRGHDARRDEQWEWLFPFYIRTETPHSHAFVSLPYSRFVEDDFHATYLLSGLWGRRVEGDNHTHWLLPLYGSFGSSQHSTLILPLFYSNRNPELGESELALFPFWYHRRSPSSTSWFTLLGGSVQHDDGTGLTLSLPYTRWHPNENRDIQIIPPLLSARDERPERRDWHTPWPLARISTGSEARPSYALPLFYRNPSTDTLVTPFYQRGTDTDAQAFWNAVLPLYYHRRTPESRAWITPLGAVTRSKSGTERTITPLYLRFEDSPEQVWHVLPPLLSWRNRTPERDDYRALLGMMRFTTGDEGGASHVLPLYYWNPATGTWATPLWARWRGNREAPTTLSPAYAAWSTRYGARINTIPPLLSWRSEQSDGARDHWLLLALASQKTNAEGDIERQHLLPFFYRNTAEDTLISAVYARWHPDRRTIRSVPPLLSWTATDPQRATRDVRLAGGLYGHTTRISDRSDRLASHLFPIWTHERDSHFWTPLVGRDSEIDGQYRYWLTPLVGTYRNQTEGAWLWPLIFWRRDAESGDHDSRFLLWGRHVTTPQRRTSSFFPLWSSRAESPEGERGPTLAESSVLLRLYDSRIESGTDDEPHEYVRRRILWRAWHYERLNGDVSVDSLPFITYDRKEDGFRRITFLWRFFRYETHPEEGRKVDFLFLPVHRGQPAQES